MIYITDSITSLQVHGLQVQAMTWFFLKVDMVHTISEVFDLIENM